MIYYSNNTNIIELVHNFDVSVSFYNQILNYLDLKKYHETVISNKEEVDQHWHLLEDDATEGEILVIMDVKGEVLEVYSQTELKTEIRRLKIALIH